MISVIIVNYRAADLVQQAVRSLTTAGDDEELELWIVDNSESDEQVQQLEQRLDGNCRLLVNRHNVGFGVACNQAYAQSRGDQILLLNPDAYLTPGALRTMRLFLQENRSVGAVGPMVYWDSGQQFFLPPSTVAAPLDWLWTKPRGRLRGYLTWRFSLNNRARCIDYWRADAPLRQKSLSGGHMLLRREAIERAGGLFDPQFFLYYEDTDLCLRLRKSGYDLYCHPGAQVVHAYGGCAPSEAQWKRAKNLQSRQRFMHKHYPGHWAQRFAARLEGTRRAPVWRPRVHALGALQQPPAVPVPQVWQDQWLLELSPSPYLLPAAGLFGSGANAAVPASTWSAMVPGTYFARVGPVSRSWIRPEVWQCQKTM